VHRLCIDLEIGCGIEGDVRAPFARREALNSSSNAGVDEVHLHSCGGVLVEVWGDEGQHGMCTVEDSGEVSDGRVVCFEPFDARAGVIGWRVLGL
jgi:hypothetical protein